jgi:hypothetical protein
MPAARHKAELSLYFVGDLKLAQPSPNTQPSAVPAAKETDSYLEGPRVRILLPPPASVARRSGWASHLDRRAAGESRANFIPTPKRKGKTPPRAVYRKSEMGYVELHGWRLPFGMTDEASRC